MPSNTLQFAPLPQNTPMHTCLLLYYSSSVFSALQLLHLKRHLHASQKESFHSHVNSGLKTAHHNRHILLNPANSPAKLWEPGWCSPCLPRTLTHLLQEETVTWTAAQSALLIRGFSARLGQWHLTRLDEDKRCILSQIGKASCIRMC